MATVKVPDVWYKTQRVARSIVQFLVVAVPMANVLAVSLIGYLNEQTDLTIPPVVFLWLNAVVVASAFIAGLFARLMTVPGVNAWLTKWLNLGTVPKSAVTTVRDLDSGRVEAVFVAPDPKAKTRADERGITHFPE